MSERRARVPVGAGRTLAATVLGAGSPAVVFDAGMGVGQATWAMVAPALGEHTRVVTYDRSGIGDSPVDPEPRTLARAASDLVALLQHLDTGPAVLVGHSYGGLIVRRVLTAAPELVAGLVLVDASDEGCELFFAAARQQRIGAAMLPAFAAVGFTRMAARRMARGLPTDERDAVVAEAGTVAAARAMRRELDRFDTDLRALRDDSVPAPDVPLTVISGARAPRGRTAARRRACLIAAHAARAAAAPQGRHVMAEHSDHLVMFDEPQLVIDEITAVLAAVRTP